MIAGGDVDECRSAAENSERTRMRMDADVVNLVEAPLAHVGTGS